MNEQLENLISKVSKKEDFPQVYELLLQEYTQDLGEFLQIVLKRSNPRMINYFFDKATLDSHAIVEYLNANFKSILKSCIGKNANKKKIKICNNMISLISALKDISEQDTLNLTLLVLDTNPSRMELLKKLGECLIVKKSILNYDYSKLSVADKEKFEKCYKEIFVEQTMCQNELPRYGEWLKKYGSSDVMPQPSSNTPPNNELYTKLETLVNTESEHIEKLENIIASLGTVAKLTAELENVKGERDSLKSTVEDLEAQLKEVKLAVSMEKSLSEQTIVTLKTDIKNSLKQPHEDYIEMSQDETIDKFCLGTIGNIFKILSKYGINL